MDQDGRRYQAVGFSVISGPLTCCIIRLRPIGFGIGGFGFTGCCSAIGSGIGFDVPVGGPTVAEASDQYVTSALITVPPEYQEHWSQYRLEVAAGGQRMAVPLRLLEASPDWQYHPPAVFLGCWQTR